MKLASVVTIAVKRGDEFLLLKVGGGLGANGDTVWGFQCGEFDGNLNGNLNDTIKRVLRKTLLDDPKVAEATKEIEYLGGYIRNGENKVFVGYNFLIENFEGRIGAGDFRWVGKDELDTLDGVGMLDETTSIFLKFHDDMI